MPDFPLLRSLMAALGLFLAFPASGGVYDDIIAAANKDDSAQVIDLLRRGMDVNTADRSGNTLLMIAARNANEELLDFLLKNRANVLRMNKYGDSAIMAAAFRGQVQIVRKLLDAGAKVRNKGWNALHYSAYAGHVEVVRLLVNGGAELDTQAPNGQTALMLAAKAGKLEAVKILVDADADLDIEDYDGKTAILLAKEHAHTETEAYLRDEGAYE